jgi:SpoIID/LytB domain protein
MHITIPTYHRPPSRPRRFAAALALAASVAFAAAGTCATGALASAPGGAVAGASPSATPNSAAGGSELVVSGAGWGHGVGMSQEGALGYAEHGYSYDAILSHYYPGTALGQAPAGARVRVLIGRHVHSIALETYVRGVVAAEMPASWPQAALEAQAIASRTYALTSHAGGSRFDVYADTRSQVYRGKAARTARSDAAVAATAGQIVTYEGRPAATYFFASSGGRTEAIQNAFPGAQPQPWLRGVSDPYDRGSLHKWTLSMSFAVAAARLHGLLRGTFEGVEVLARGYSPRILSAYVLGSAGRTLVTGATLAARLQLYGTWAYFSARTNGTLVAMRDRSGAARMGSPPVTSEGGSTPTPSVSEPSASAATGGAASGGTSAPA